MSPKSDEAVKPFLQACMKLLCNQKAMDNLQALIYSCVENVSPQPDVKTVNKLYKNKKRAGVEIHMTTQIGDYEMDQFIPDLGSDSNVMPKKTW